jgi:hypothetical protein
MNKLEFSSEIPLSCMAWFVTPVANSTVLVGKVTIADALMI